MSDIGVDDSILIYLGACILASQQSGFLLRSPEQNAQMPTQFVNLAQQFLTAAKAGKDSQ